MKIGGKELKQNAHQIFVFPRPDGDIVIKVTAIMDSSEFDTLVPMVEPPTKIVKGGARVADTDDKKYLKQVTNRSALFNQWMQIRSLRAIDPQTKEEVEIEWEMVNINDHKTWSKWEDELKASGFSDIERKRLFQAIWEINCLSDKTLEEARNSFLASPPSGKSVQISQTEEQTAMQPGEPVNGSVSDPQESQLVGTT
jgi:hypothetical protein